MEAKIIELRWLLNERALVLSDEITFEDVIAYVDSVTSQDEPYTLPQWIQDTLDNYPESFKK